MANDHIVLQYCHHIPIDSVARHAYTFKFFANRCLPRVLVDMVTSNAALPFVSPEMYLLRGFSEHVYVLQGVTGHRNRSHEGALEKITHYTV